MTSQIDELCVAAEADMAPLRAALQQIERETERTSTEIARQLGRIGAAIDRLRGQFVNLQSSLPTSNSAKAGQQEILRASDAAQESVEALRKEFTRLDYLSDVRIGAFPAASILPDDATLDQKVTRAIDALKALEKAKIELFGDPKSLESRLESAATLGSLGLFRGPLFGAGSAAFGLLSPEVLDLIDFSILEKLELFRSNLIDSRKKLSEENLKLAETLSNPGNTAAVLHQNDVEFIEGEIERIEKDIALAEDRLRRAEAEASLQLEIVRDGLGRQIQSSSSETGQIGFDQAASQLEELSSKAAALTQTISSGLGSALQDSIQNWQPWQQAGLDAVCALEEKVQGLGEALRTLPLPDSPADSNERSDLNGGGGQGRLAGGIGSDRVGIDVASLGGTGFAGYATPIFPVPLADQGDWRSGMLQALTGQTEAFRQAQEALAPVVAEADAALVAQGATFERLRAQGALTEELLGRVSRRLIEQVGALLRNADSWDDWALGVLGSLETVLRSAIGGSGQDSGGLGGIFTWLEELLGLGGDGGGIVPGTPGSAAIGPLSTAFGFAGGGVPAVGVPALVGERGPELVVPKLPMRVIDHARTRALLDGDGGGGEPGPTVIINETIHLHGNPTQSEAHRMVQTARAVANARVERLLDDINRGKAPAKVTGRRRG